MRGKVLQAVLTSTESVFSTMLGKELTAGEVFENKGAANPTDWGGFARRLGGTLDWDRQYRLLTTSCM